MEASLRGALNLSQQCRRGPPGGGDKRALTANLTLDPSPVLPTPTKESTTTPTTTTRCAGSVVHPYAAGILLLGPGCGATPRTPPSPPDVHRSHIPHRPSSWPSTPSTEELPTEELPTSVAVSPLRLETTPSSAPVSPRNLPACALDPGIADLRRHLSRGRRRGPLTPDHCCRAQSPPDSVVDKKPALAPAARPYFLPLLSRHSHHQPPHYPIPSPSPIPP